MDDVVTDSMTSMVSGLSGERDKFSELSHFHVPLRKEQIDAAYKGNWMARKGINIPAHDMTREWRSWQAEKDQIEAIEEEEKRLKLQQKVKQALSLSRRYGGAVLLLGVRSDNPRTELKPESIRQGDLKYVHVMSRYDIGHGQMRLDPEDPYYGQPDYYELRTEFGTYRHLYRIHPSRVILFCDESSPVSERLQTPWGDSVLEHTNDAVKSATLANQAISVLMTEAGVDVISMPGLMAQLATEESTARVTARLQRAQAIKSLINALVLDGGGPDGKGGETYEKKQVNFAHLPDVLQAQMQVASAAFDIPATRFLSQSPKGMNSTGESDLKNYYDRIRAEQKNDLGATLRTLDEILIRTSTGERDKSIYYDWRPLFQKDAKELAEIEKILADAVKAIVDTGTVSDQIMSKAVVNGLIERGQLPGLEAAVEEFGKATGDFEAELDQDLPEDDDLIADELTIDATPRTLYVHRQLLNAEEFLTWAREQGFSSTLAADDIHVTIAFSRHAVDWMKAGVQWSEGDGEFIVPAGGPRVVEQLGDKGAVVLHFTSIDLTWRHWAIRRDAGASWDYPGYQPHVTITYDGADMDLSKVKPFTGQLRFGPEIFSEVVDDWEKGKG